MSTFQNQIELMSLGIISNNENENTRRPNTSLTLSLSLLMKTSSILLEENNKLSDFLQDQKIP